MRILCASYRHWTGRELLDPVADGAAAVAQLDAAPYAVLSHGTEADPIFNYSNRSGLALFEISLPDLLLLPSRASAEPLLQQDRDRLLQQVTRYGYLDGYEGIRISGRGNRFRIRNATIWNLLDETGQYHGQAALLPEWEPV